jgi:hypothetical protein
MCPADPSPPVRTTVDLAALEAENRELRDRLESAERYTAQTLARATRLSQVISVLGHDTDFDQLVDHAAIEVAELFSADIALLMVGSDDDVCVEGHWGMRATDVPCGRFAVAGLEGLTSAEPVMIGSPGEESLGLMLLVRRSPEPFERSDEKELRAIAYRIALAMENGLLHRRMSDQLVRVSRIQEFTTRLAGTLELEPVAGRVAEMLVSEVPVSASVVLVEREGELAPVARCGVEDIDPLVGPRWASFPLETTGKPVGRVAVADVPAAGSEARELLHHLLGVAAMAVDKALLFERSRAQARQDSLTGLLGHRVFHEVLEERTGQGATFSVVLVDIDDFKQIKTSMATRPATTPCASSPMPCAGPYAATTTSSGSVARSSASSFPSSGTPMPTRWPSACAATSARSCPRCR